MPKTDSRIAFQMRRAFWKDKAENAERIARLERERDSAIVADWMARFQSAKNNRCV